MTLADRTEEIGVVRGERLVLVEETTYDLEEMADGVGGRLACYGSHRW